MQFERMSKYHKESSEGYVIAASRVNGGWVFSASGPKRPSIRNGNTINALKDPLRGQIPFRESYDIGDEIPARRELLGCYREDQCGGIDAAKAQAEAACVQHQQKVLQHLAEQQSTSDAEQLRVLPSETPCEPPNPRYLASDMAESLPNSDRPGDVVVAQSGGAR